MNDIIYRIATQLPALMIAIVLHEWAHAYVASKFGDDTAKMSGRLTLNPAAHYDLLGTIIFPLLSIFMGGIMFGWAKPVPVDPRRFKNMKAGIFWVSFAGPLANLFLALVSSFLLAILVTKIPPEMGLHRQFLDMARNLVLINLVLAVFNLIPFPPLDGSKMLSIFLSYENARRYDDLQRYSFIFILILWTTKIFQYLLMPALALGNGMIHFFMSILG